VYSFFVGSSVAELFAQFVESLSLDLAIEKSRLLEFFLRKSSSPPPLFRKALRYDAFSAPNVLVRQRLLLYWTDLSL
jgi:hypothetical protein